MLPDRVFPVVGRLVLLHDQFPVHFHAQTGQPGQCRIAVHKGEIVLIVHIVQNTCPHIVVDAHALFLNDRIVAGGVHVQTGSQRNGAERAVRRKGHIVALSHGCDLLDLGDAAGMRQVRLYDVHAAAGQQTLEVIFGKQPLTCGDGDVAACGDLLKALHVLTQDRLLNEHGVKLLQLFGQDLGHGLVHPTVEVDGNAKIFAADLTDGRHPLQHRIDLIVGVDHLQFLGCIHLNGPEALVHFLLGGSSHVTGAIPADPRIYLHAIPALTPHELVDRHAKHLAFDIPQGLIDAGNGAHQHTAAPIKACPVEHRPKPLNVGGILADEVVPHLLHTGQHRLGMSLQNGLAPTGNAAVGLDLHKAPSGPHIVRIDRCDLHPAIPFPPYL